MNKQRYTITLNGCDDQTEFIMWLTEEEAALLRKVAVRSEQVCTYQCMPTLSVKKCMPTQSVKKRRSDERK